jgi:hypothetical protein
MKALCLLTLLFAVLPLQAATKPVNLVFILTDNQGAWTLGCYGNPDIRTPHIDRTGHRRDPLHPGAQQQSRSAPPRATFLTGLIPSQHGLHSFLDEKFMMGPEAYNTLQELHFPRRSPPRLRLHLRSERQMAPRSEHDAQ